MKFTVIYRYDKNEDPDCDCDYIEVNIFDEHGEKIIGYGDYYHDKGEDKVDGFFDGVSWTNCEQKNEIEVKHIADYEW